MFRPRTPSQPFEHQTASLPYRRGFAANDRAAYADRLFGVRRVLLRSKRSSLNVRSRLSPFFDPALSEESS